MMKPRRRLGLGAETSQIECGDVETWGPLGDQIGEQLRGNDRECQAEVLVPDCIKYTRPARDAAYAGQVVRQGGTRPHPTRSLELAVIAQRAQPGAQTRGLARVRGRFQSGELEVARSSQAADHRGDRDLLVRVDDGRVSKGCMAWELDVIAPFGFQWRA